MSSPLKLYQIIFVPDSNEFLLRGFHKQLTTYTDFVIQKKLLFAYLQKCVTAFSSFTL